MKIEEFKQKHKILEEEYNSKRVELFKDYANSNNPYKIGDKVTDHIGTIEIEKIQVRINSYIFHDKMPSECIYFGTNFTKSGSISKREPKRNVYQSNILKESEDVSKA